MQFANVNVVENALEDADDAAAEGGTRSNLLGAVATYECEDGFDTGTPLETSPDRLLCKVVDTERNTVGWVGGLPTCKVVDCGKGLLRPPVTKADTKTKINGHFTVSKMTAGSFETVATESTMGSSVKFTCDEGYELKGKEASDCQNDHQWSAAAPTCEPVPCPQPEREPLLPDQATFKGDKFFFAEGITVKCDVGYEFARFETTAGANRQAETTTRTCQADGTWSGPHPDCHPVFCGGLEAPKFGSMAGKNLNFKGEVTFQCDDGYALVGSASTNCLASAAWSTLAPVCHELPHKVEGVALVGHTDQAAKVTWGGHPKPGLKPIQVYTLFWETADKQLSGQSSTFDASMTAMELEGLPPASDVLISVAAVSDVGTGAKSDPVAQHTCRACLNGGVVDYAYECECACNLPWSGDICEIRDKSLDNYEDGAAKEESASKDEADAAGKDRQAADAVKAQGKADEKKAQGAMSGGAALGAVDENGDPGSTPGFGVWDDGKDPGDADSFGGFSDAGDTGIGGGTLSKDRLNEKHQPHAAKMNRLNKAMEGILANVDENGNYIWDQVQVERACEAMVKDCDCGAQIASGDAFFGFSATASKTIDVRFGSYDTEGNFVVEPMSYVPTLSAPYSRIEAPDADPSGATIVLLKNRYGKCVGSNAAIMDCTLKGAQLSYDGETGHINGMHKNTCLSAAMPPVKVANADFEEGTETGSYKSMVPPSWAASTGSKVFKVRSGMGGPFKGVSASKGQYYAAIKNEGSVKGGITVTATGLKARSVAQVTLAAGQIGSTGALDVVVDGEVIKTVNAADLAEESFGPVVVQFTPSSQTATVTLRNIGAVGATILIDDVKVGSKLTDANSVVLAQSVGFVLCTEDDASLEWDFDEDTGRFKVVMDDFEDTYEFCLYALNPQKVGTGLVANACQTNVQEQTFDIVDISEEIGNYNFTANSFTRYGFKYTATRTDADAKQGWFFNMNVHWLVETTMSQAHATGLFRKEGFRRIGGHYKTIGSKTVDECATACHEEGRGSCKGFDFRRGSESNTVPAYRGTCYLVNKQVSLDSPWINDKTFDHYTKTHDDYGFMTKGKHGQIDMCMFGRCCHIEHGEHDMTMKSCNNGAFCDSDHGVMYTFIDEDAEDENLEGWCDNKPCSSKPESLLLTQISEAVATVLSAKEGVDSMSARARALMQERGIMSEGFGRQQVRGSRGQFGAPTAPSLIDLRQRSGSSMRLKKGSSGYWAGFMKRLMEHLNKRFQALIAAAQNAPAKETQLADTTGGVIHGLWSSKTILVAPKQVYKTFVLHGKRHNKIRIIMKVWRVGPEDSSGRGFKLFADGRQVWSKTGQGPTTCSSGWSESKNIDIMMDGHTNSDTNPHACYTKVQVDLTHWADELTLKLAYWHNDNYAENRKRTTGVTWGFSDVELKMDPKPCHGDFDSQFFSLLEAKSEAESGSEAYNPNKDEAIDTFTSAWGSTMQQARAEILASALGQTPTEAAAMGLDRINATAHMPIPRGQEQAIADIIVGELNGVESSVLHAVRSTVRGGDHPEEYEEEEGDDKVQKGDRGGSAGVTTFVQTDKTLMKRTLLSRRQGTKQGTGYNFWAMIVKAVATNIRPAVEQNMKDHIESFRGPNGHKGNTGNTGHTGHTGSPGTKGNTGRSGATGHVGATGHRGATGHVGAEGHVGAVGPKGEAAPKWPDTNMKEQLMKAGVLKTPKLAHDAKDDFRTTNWQAKLADVSPYEEGWFGRAYVASMYSSVEMCVANVQHITIPMRKGEVPTGVNTVSSDDGGGMDSSEFKPTGQV